LKCFHESAALSCSPQARITVGHPLVGGSRDPVVVRSVANPPHTHPKLLTASTDYALGCGGHTKDCDPFIQSQLIWVSRVSGFGVRVSGFGFRVSGFGVRDSGFGFRVSGFGFRGCLVVVLEEADQLLLVVHVRVQVPCCSELWIRTRQL